VPVNGFSERQHAFSINEPFSLSVVPKLVDTAFEPATIVAKFGVPSFATVQPVPVIPVAGAVPPSCKLRATEPPGADTFLKYKVLVAIVHPFKFVGATWIIFNVFGYRRPNITPLEIIAVHTIATMPVAVNSSIQRTEALNRWLT